MDGQGLEWWGMSADEGGETRAEHQAGGDQTLRGSNIEHDE